MNEEFEEVKKNIPIHQYFLENIPNNDKLCMYNVVTRERLHYHNLPPKIFFLSKHLIKKLSVKKKDRFAILLKPNFSLGVHILLFLSIIATGAVVSFIDTNLEEEEIIYRLRKFQPKVIITHEDKITDKLLTEKTEFLITTGDRKRILGLNVKILPIKPFLLMFEDMEPIEQLFESNDIVCVPFNSQGKGVQLSQGNLISNLSQLNLLTEVSNLDTILLHYPYHHVFTLIVSLWCIMKGARVITFPHFTLEKFILTISKCKVTHAFIGIENILEIYGRFRKKNDYSVDFSTLKCITCLGSNQLSRVIQKELSDRMKIKVKQVYGYNETLLLSLSHHGHNKRKTSSSSSPLISSSSSSSFINTPIGSSGHLLLYTKVQVVERKTKKRLGYNQTGEILIRKAPQIMSGYIGEREHESFYTGDVGYFDHKNYLYIIDRKQNTIEVDGKEFYQSELRDLLVSHHDIMDAAILNDMGIIKGVCVRKPGLGGREINPRDIIMFIFKKISSKKEDESHKIINQIQFVEKIPRDSAGSVRRLELKRICMKENNDDIIGNDVPEIL